jgi:hypothetical protein
MTRLLILPLLLIGTASAQDIHIKKVAFSFSKAHWEKASVAYGLHDAERNRWSAHSGNLMPAGHSFLEIPATTDRFKAFVWTPGCKVKQFDVRVERSEIELQFVCEPLSNITFLGRVKGTDVGGTTISVSYGGMKACRWIEDQMGPVWFVDCLGYQIVGIATAAVATDGRFKMGIPNFSADPTISGDSSSELAFGIHGLKGVFILQPEPSKGVLTKADSIEVGPPYPGEVTFLAVPFENFPVKMR